MVGRPHVARKGIAGMATSLVANPMSCRLMLWTSQPMSSEASVPWQPAEGSGDGSGILDRPVEPRAL